MFLQKNNTRKLRLNYECTLNCNLKCKYCTNCVDRIRTHDGNEDTEKVFIERVEEYINDNYIKNEFNEYPILINLSGGEPLINKNVIELSQKFLDLGCMVTLDTDFALTISEEKLKGIRNLLLNDRFYLYITHHEKSPTNEFRKNVESIIDLKRTIRGNENRYFDIEYENIQFFYLNWWENRDEQMEHFEYLRSLGIDLNEIRFMEFYSYKIKPNQENFQKTYDYMKEKLNFSYEGPKYFLLGDTLINDKEFFDKNLNILGNSSRKCIPGNYHLSYYGKLYIGCGTNTDGDLGDINKNKIPTPKLRICNAKNCGSPGGYEQCKII